MKRNVKLGKAITLTAAALIAPLLLVGCHESSLTEEKNAANNRWLELRSSMMLEMGKQQFATGDLTQAEKTVKDGLAIDPANADLHVLGGRILMERGKLERSYHMFNGALQLEPEHAEASYYQGLVMQRWERNDQALGFYQKAFESEPDNPSYLLAVAEIMVELDRVDDAVSLLEDKRQYFDQNAGVRATLGHLYMVKNQPAEASEYFRQASLLDPESLRLQEELGYALLAAGENKQAIGVFESLLKEPSQKDRVDLRRALANAYIQTNQSREAYDLLLQLGRSSKGSVGDWIKAGELAYGLNDLGGALQAASKAMSLAPERHEGYLLAGMVWQKRENLDNALQMFDRAAKAAPSSTEPLILRGLTLQKAGRHAAAAEAYSQALKRQPNDTRARQLLAAVSENGG